MLIIKTKRRAVVLIVFIVLIFTLVLAWNYFLRQPNNFYINNKRVQALKSTQQLLGQLPLPETFSRFYPTSPHDPEYACDRGSKYTSIYGPPDGHWLLCEYRFDQQFFEIKEDRSSYKATTTAFLKRLHENGWSDRPSFRGDPRTNEHLIEESNGVVDISLNKNNTYITIHVDAKTYKERLDDLARDHVSCFPCDEVDKKIVELRNTPYYLAHISTLTVVHKF